MGSGNRESQNEGADVNTRQIWNTAPFFNFAAGRLYFASEIKALFCDTQIERCFDHYSLCQIFSFWAPVAPKSPYSGISQIIPGHYLIYRAGAAEEPVQKPYFTIRFPRPVDESPFSIEEHAEELHNRIVKAAVSRFTNSDVPVGAYLSGGIDSAVAAAVISRYANVPLQTFSIRFEDSEYDEGPFQKEVVQELELDHHTLTVQSRLIGEIFPDVMKNAECPILRTAPAPLFLLSKSVKSVGYKVVVTGEGADEMLCGYDIFKEMKVRAFIARDAESTKRWEILRNLYPWMKRTPNLTPAIAKAFFMADTDTADVAMSHRTRWNTTRSLFNLFSTDLKSELTSGTVVEDLIRSMPYSCNGWGPLSRAQWLEIKTLLSEYILSSQGDRMLMANSVEGRFPFLDPDVTAFSACIPERHKMMGLNEKYILKKAFHDMIPAAVLNRPKQPYRAPDASSFFSGNSHEWVSELLSRKYLDEAGIFDPNSIKLLLAKCSETRGKNMSNTDNMRICGVISTMLLFEEFIKNGGKSCDGLAAPELVTEDRINS